MIMIKKKWSLLLIMMAVTPIVLVGCHRSQSVDEQVMDTLELESTPMPEPEPEVMEEMPTPAPQPARPAVKKAPETEEVIYISGHGTNGRVWGHVTMKGDKGKGSVTDEQENALTITCTRHGEELICYDQNSRQYIFKL